MNKIIFLILVFLIMSASVVTSVYLVEKEDHEHRLTEVAEVAPTCNEEGTKAYFKCSLCDKIFADADGENKINAPEKIEKTAHTEVIDPAKAATCTEKGLTEGKHCSACNTVIVEQKSVAALGHAWDEGVVTTAPTCENKGVKTFTCQNDGAHTRTEDIDALGHAWDEGVVTTAPTCENKGVKTFTCQNDGAHTRTEDIDALGHDIQNVGAQNATCTEIGWDAYEKCVRCSYSTYVEISAKGHDYSDEWSSDAEKHWHICNNGCGVSGGSENHIPNIDAATETTSKICTVCEYVMEAALGHTTHAYNIPMYDENHHWNKCYGCNEIDEKIAHTYSETITKQPGCTEAGKKTLACTCGYHYEAEISAAGHNYNSVVTDPTCTAGGYTTYTCSKCSDSYVGDNTDAAGHNYNSVVTNPTCQAEGYTTYTCSKCGDSYIGDRVGKADHADIAPKDFVCDDCSAIIIDESASKNEYTFGVSTNNPFDASNGGSADGLSVTTHGTNGKYYENTFGKTMSFTIYVDEATVVDFYLMVNARWNGVTTDNTITEILLDGSTYGVMRASSAIAPTDPDGLTNSSEAWITSNAAKVKYATIALHAGANVISFTRTTVNSQSTNINICGVKIDSTIEAKLPTYSFSLPEADPFASENGGYTNVTAGNLILNNASNGSFYQNTYGKTFTFRVYAEKASTAGFYIHLNHAKAATDVFTTIGKLVVNGVDVTANMVNTPIPNTNSWNLANSVYIFIADVELKEGINEITFVRVEGTNDLNNLNIRGVKLVSDAPVSLPDVYSFNADTATGDHANDPFVSTNGGSNSEASTFKAENNVYRYGDGKDAVLTTTIYSECDTTVVFMLNAAWRTNEYFGYNMYANGHAHISSFTLNGSTEGVTPSDKQYFSVGWFTFTQVELATLELKAGYNVISFTIAGDADQGDNINYIGVSILSDTEVSLGKTYNFTMDTATGDQTNDPFTEANGGSVSDTDVTYVEGSVHRYGNGKNATLTTTIVLTEKTTLVYNFVCAWRVRGSSIGVFTPSATTGGDLHPYLTNFTVKDADGNAVTDGITLSDKSYNSIGWNTFTPCEVATMTLEAGTYQISFTISGDNMNYTGISIISNKPVALAKKTVTE